MRASNFLVSVAILSILVACGGKGREQAIHQAPAAAPSAGPAPTPATGAGEPFAPLSSRGTPVTASAPSGPSAAGLTYTLPAHWQPTPPASSMRIGQAAIPGPAGPGELAVFFFGPGGGGGLEANLERWVGQVENPGTPVRETFEVNGLRVTWIDVAGTIKPSQMGQGPTTAQPGSRLYGAVVEGPGGPWFFKATGPDATLAGERESFLALIRSVRRQ
ncbi:MAG TPA: hypothetical protein VF017_23825 [Thermoanaerobaculia bacterium]|nr:hypothetical protein [Thermoanaerobaculia bacterium]